MNNLDLEKTTYKLVEKRFEYLIYYVPLHGNLGSVNFIQN